MTTSSHVRSNPGIRSRAGCAPPAGTSQTWTFFTPQAPLGASWPRNAICFPSGDDPDVPHVEAVVRVRLAVGDERDPEAVGRPRRIGVVPLAVGQLDGALVADPDDVEMVALPVEETRPLLLIVKPRDVAQRRLFLFLPERRIGVLVEDDRQA